MFSNIAFQKYSEMERRHLQFQVDDEDLVHVWGSKYSWEDRDQSKSYVTYRVGERCNCNNRFSFEVQCEHELCVDKKLIVSKWSPWWLNQSTYRQQFSEQLAPPVPLPVNGEFGIGHDSIDDGGFDGMEFPENDDSVTENASYCQEVNISGAPAPQVSYQLLHGLCEQYLKLINGKTEHMNSFHSTINELIHRASRGLPTAATFATVLQQPEERINSPLRGTLRPSQKRARFISRHEVRSGQKKRKASTPSCLYGSNDVNYVDHNVLTKACTFCRGTHKYDNCKYKAELGTEIPRKNESKFAFAANLQKTHYYKTSPSALPRGKAVLTKLPRQLSGMVICKKVSNDVLLITLLKAKGGAIHEVYQNYPFSMDVCVDYIRGGVKSRTIIHNLEINERTEDDNINFKGLVNLLTQNSNSNLLSQLSKLSGYQADPDTDGRDEKSSTDLLSQLTDPTAEPGIHEGDIGGI